MFNKGAFLFSVLCLSSLVFGVNAQNLPPELHGWRGWVMDGEAARQCALVSGKTGQTLNDFQCVATTDLILAPDGEGISFTTRVKNDLDTVIILPGQNQRWPQNIQVDGKEATLRLVGEQWQLVLKAGEHQVQGKWASAFDRVDVPDIFGRVVWLPDMRVLRREGGQAWIQAQAAESKVNNDNAPSKVQVWRLLTDGQAIHLTTQIMVHISGEPKRLSFGHIFPEGFRALSWESSVPAVITKNNTLDIQAGRGVHTITIEAQCDKACLPTKEGKIPEKALTLLKSAKPWPIQEVWSFSGNSAFRQLSVDGIGVDPAQAQVPDAWRGNPAYIVGSGQPIHIKVAARGRIPGEGEKLSLVRNTWMTSNGWLHHDHLIGVLPVGGRLSMLTPYKLGRIEAQGQPMPLSIDGGGEVGMEFGQGGVDAWAQSTQPLGRAATTGWNATIDQMNVRLFLPPGVALISVPGAGAGSGSWIDKFTLLSFFGIALLILLLRQAMGNLAAILAGLVAAGWIGNGSVLGILWLVAIATTLHLVVGAIPKGRLNKTISWTRTGALIFTLMLLVPFSGKQAKLVLHPQLDGNQSGVSSQIARVMVGEDRQAMESTVNSKAGGGNAPAAAPMMAMISSPRVNSPNTSNAVDANDPLAGIGLASVGTPLPTWQQNGIGTQHTLVYPGPIKPSISGSDNDTSMVIVAPVWIIQILRALGTLALLWLILRLLFLITPKSWATRAPSVIQKWQKKLVLILFLVPGLALANSGQEIPGQIHVPANELLVELKTKLTQPPSCAPNCVSLINAQLDASGNNILATYRVSVEYPTTWKIPIATGADLVNARVEGQLAWWANDTDILLSPGFNRVLATYRATSDRISIELPTSPLVKKTNLMGWSSPSDSTDGSWSIERQKGEIAPTTKEIFPEAIKIPGYVQVIRKLVFGSNIEITTSINRSQGNTGELKVELPTIKGETLLSENIERNGDNWVATLPAGKNNISWQSKIDVLKEGVISMTPINSDIGIEIWQISKGNAWTITMTGVPENSPNNDLRTIFPLEGETLTINASKLPAAIGQKQRIDSVWLNTEAGPQIASNTLMFTATTAQAGDRTITFPTDSEIVSILLNNQPLSLPLKNGKLVIPLQRGEQTVQIQWRSQVKRSILTTPAIDLGSEASNVVFKLSHTQNRWVLFTAGPGWGTAVLYWSQLLVLLTLAFGLSKIPGKLFSLNTAMLLVLGFSTFYGTVFWLTILISWVAWVAWRETLNPESMTRIRFNLLQLAMAAFTIFTVIAITSAIAYGLLGARPDMMLRAPPGLNLMEWLMDKTPNGPLLGPTVISLPIWTYQSLLFLWALWFASWLISSVKKSLTAWLGRGYWRNSRPTNILAPDNEPPVDLP